jgi:hypothetical protein
MPTTYTGSRIGEYTIHLIVYLTRYAGHASTDYRVLLTALMVSRCTRWFRKVDVATDCDLPTLYALQLRVDKPAVGVRLIWPADNDRGRSRPVDNLDRRPARLGLRHGLSCLEMFNRVCLPCVEA